MGNRRMINLISETGEIDRIELLCAFDVEELNGKYVIYTKNEKTTEGHCIIYSGKIAETNGEQQLVNIEDGIEWEKLKSIMKQMTKYSLEGDVNE